MDLDRRRALADLLGAQVAAARRERDAPGPAGPDPAPGPLVATRPLRTRAQLRPVQASVSASLDPHEVAVAFAAAAQARWCPAEVVRAVLGRPVPPGLDDLAVDVALRALAYDRFDGPGLDLGEVPWFLAGFSSTPRLEALSDRICFALPLDGEQRDWIARRRLEPVALGSHRIVRLVDPAVLPEAAARMGLGWLAPTP